MLPCVGAGFELFVAPYDATRRDDEQSERAMNIAALKKLALPETKLGSPHSSQKQDKRVWWKGRLRFLFQILSVLPLEFLYSPGTIEKLLLPRKERMTAGTDLDTHFFLGIDRFVGRAASACYRRLVQLWVDILFHDAISSRIMPW